MSSPFLSTLNDAQRAELEALFRPRAFAAGEVLFEQGAPADGAFLVEEGVIDLFMAVPGGEDVRVERVKAGAFLGEPALLEATRRNLAARAVEPVRTQHIDRLDFQGLRHGFRPVSFLILEEITRLAAARVIDTASRTRALGPAVPNDAEPAPPLGELESPGAAFDPRDYVGDLPFFEELTRADLDELFAMATLWTLPRGRPLLHQGEPSSRCFVVVRGAVEALDRGTGVRLALHGPGELVGQLSPLLETPSLVDVIVREGAVVMELGPDACAELFAPRSRLSFKFMHAACLATLRLLAIADRALARATKHSELRRLR